MIIQGATVLYGENLEIKENSDLSIAQGKFAENASDQGPKVNGRGLLVIPGLINAHVHVADSVAKDIGVGRTLTELVHPIHGLKMKILREKTSSDIEESITETLNDMIRCGTTSIADFREGGLEGVKLLERASKSSKIRTLILGRPNQHFSQEELTNSSLARATVEELKSLLREAYGVGLSGPNEYPDSALGTIGDLTRASGRFMAVHVAEAAESVEFSLKNFGRTEVARALDHLKPNMLVHLTNASEDDIRRVVESGVSVACCPSANSILGVGIPPIERLLEEHVTVALGTDNVMLNSPDLFREMDYLSKIVRGRSKNPKGMDNRQVLKLCTIDAARALGIEARTGSISAGKDADAVFIDLNSFNLKGSRDLIAAVVHRARPDNIAAVMIQGEVVYGKLSS